MPRTRSLLGFTVALLGVAVAGFIVARSVRATQSEPIAFAQPTPRPPSPTAIGLPTAVPTPVATIAGGLPAFPDTSVAHWPDLYIEAQNRLPRYDITINGITVGPDQPKRVRDCVPDTVNR